MTLIDFLTTEYQKSNFNYSAVVATAYKKYGFQISIKQIRRELNRIIGA